MGQSSPPPTKEYIDVLKRDMRRRKTNEKAVRSLAIEIYMTTLKTGRSMPIQSAFDEAIELLTSEVRW
jgi:hypothetical protein